MNPPYMPQQPPYGAPPPQGYPSGPQPSPAGFGPPPGPGGMPPMMGNPPRPYGPPLQGPAAGLRPGPPSGPVGSPYAGQALPRPPTPNQLAQQMAGMQVNQGFDGGFKSPLAGPPNPLLYPPGSSEVNGSSTPQGQFQFQTPQGRPPGPPGLPTPGMPPKGMGQPQQVPPQFQNGATPQHDGPYSPAVVNGPYGAPNLPPAPQQMASPAAQPAFAAPYPGSPYAGPPLPQQQQQQPLQQPGYPPQGNMANRYPPSPAGYAPPGPGMPQQQMQQQQPPRRLDPDQMPSPIQVMEDDKKSRSGVFYTNTRGQVPPLVTTPFVTQDQGNAGPRFIRSSMYSIPTQPDMMKQTAVPFSLVISPFAELESGEMEPPLVDMGELGPVRCVRCKAYMCPFMQFVDGGRRFQCPFCKVATEVPAEYFEHLDHTGSRLDKYRRPELCLGSYEFAATKDYCRNNVPPKPPAYVFVIDVSYNNVKSGLVHLLCQNMKSILQQLPCETDGVKSSARVGFITYSHEVHFYNIKSSLAQPQMMVVGDVQDMFMPLLDGFLCDVSESEAVIDQLMLQIPNIFAESRETETILGPALQAGLEALKAAECSGKLLVFHSSLPIAEAPGKLKNRDDRKLLGTEKEKTILAPQSTFYNQLGQECAAAGCSVDLFISNNAYIDLATIGQIARLTGGQVYKYTYFQAELEGERLLEDAKRSVSRTVAFDTVMRVRTSTGVRPVDFYGHFFMSNTTDVEMAAIDRDKAVTVEVKHDDKLTDEDGVYIQVAVLYTSVGGQRRLRIHNLSLNVCSQMADLYRSCDLDTIMNLLMKQSVTRLTDGTPKALRDGLINRSAQMLACYRKNCASPSSPGQLILPECMKLLPLYINCLMKSDALSGGADITTDERTFNMYAVQTMDVASTLAYLYPRLIPLHEQQQPEEVPSPVRCTVEKLRDDGVYILENGIHMFLWIGLAVSNDWIHQVFGVQSAAQIDIDRSQLMELDNPLSLQVRDVIARVSKSRPRHMKLTLVRQRDKLDIVFKKFLVEDRHSDVSVSYVDFLCHLHKEIRNLLN